MSVRPVASALIADDEPLLRDGLKRELLALWPELQIVAEARNGDEAIAMFDACSPRVCFLDVQMPGLTGLEAAQAIREREADTHIVFVTAFQHYAVEAFEHAALDYLVKPLAADRLAMCVERLCKRLRQNAAPAAIDDTLANLTRQLAASAEPQALRWIRAQSGNTLHIVSIADIDYVRSDTKYTKIAWREPDGEPREALVRTALKELEGQLPADRFARIHRSVIVNLHAVRHVRRGDNETAEVHLRERAETLPVSRAYLHVFRQP